MITWNSINSEIDGLYLDNKFGIVPRHNYLTGQRNYVLATLEQLIGYLDRNIKNDDMIKFLSDSIRSVTQKGNKRYFEVIQEVQSVAEIEVPLKVILERVERDYLQNTLSDPEALILTEISSMNLNEYLMKSDYQRCDYGAMLTLTTLAYQIILQGLDRYINSIEIFVDTDGVLTSWQFDYADGRNEHIWIQWTALDKIDHYYSIYLTNCGGLSENSMMDLASADAVEEQFLKNEDRRTVSYNMLVKQYCGVIEQEVNEIIQLNNLPNKPLKHLMWKKMMDYVKDNNIVLVGGLFTLNEVLTDLYGLHNLSSHGEKITEEQYSILVSFKERQLFEFISWTKLELTGKRFEPVLPKK